WLIDRVFQKEMWDFMLVYIDNVNIYSPDFNKHLEHVTIVLDHLCQADLKLNPDKCFFRQSKISFLGHEISDLGISAAESKVAAISKFARPKNLRAFRGFLGLEGFYRRFIWDFYKLATPLYKLLKSEEKFEWKEKQQEAFKELKNRLISAPILAHPHASHLALGTVFAQQNDEGIECMVNMQMAQYIMTLQGYDFIVKYKPRNQLGNVDGLSHMESKEDEAQDLSRPC
ncbi:25041_t:CDS:2, partial [Gigaspora rosea]